MNKRHQEIYRFYLDYRLKTGKFPILDEIGNHLGVSKQYVYQEINKMVKEGYLFSRGTAKIRNYRPAWLERWSYKDGKLKKD